MQLIIGWKSHQASAKPEIIYCGNDGDEALAAISKVASRGFVRAQRLVNPRGAPVQLPEPEAEPVSTSKSKKA